MAKAKPSRPSPYVVAFGERVRSLRLEAGLTQEQLADRAGLHRTSIPFIERASRSSTLDTIAAIAHGLGVQPSELMPSIVLRQGRGKK